MYIYDRFFISHLNSNFLNVKFVQKSRFFSKSLKFQVFWLFYLNCQITGISRFLHNSRFFDKNIEKEHFKKIYSRYFEKYRSKLFNKIEIFAFLICAVHKKPIELYGFALCILGVLGPLYTFKPKKVQCSIPYNIYDIRFHLNSINLLLLANIFLANLRIKLVLHGV